MTRPAFHRYPRPGAAEPAPGDRGPYYPDDPLKLAVNTALSVGQPLLVTGEAGCGKTALAWSVAAELGLGEVLRLHVRSDHQARDALYTFDSLRRLHDVQGPPADRARATDPENYVRYQALGRAIVDAQQQGQKRVVLIDEIDKAPTDFPNDLLDQMDQMSFEVEETGRRFTAPAPLRPIVIITSNQERQLPKPFLRRCVFHHIEFPKPDRLRRILAAHCHEVAERLREHALPRFLQLRDVKGQDKPPGTAELITWVQVLHHAGVDLSALTDAVPLGDLPALGVLIKGRDDLDRLPKQRP